MAVSSWSGRGLHILSKINFRNLKLFGYKLRYRSLYTAGYNQTLLINLNFQRLRNQIERMVSLSHKAMKMESEKCQDKLGSSFQQLMQFRMKQAQCSVLIELNKKEDIPSVVSTCQKLGAVNNLYCYSGVSKNVFLLLEFSDEESVRKLLKQCENENVYDTFSVSSRILCFQRKSTQDAPELTLEVNEDVIDTTKKFKPQSVSAIIETIYDSEKLSELDTRLRYFFCGLLKDSLSGLFPYCDVYPFGSSVNGVGRNGCDLDLMIRLYPLPSENCKSEFSFLNKTCIGKIQELQRKVIYALGDYFGTFLPGISGMKKILHARVPILKFNHKILRLDCDISVNNVSPILMSEMLFFCGEIDSRLHPLLYAVKKWAKEANITYETPGSWITNFGLSLLVVFFLQNRPLPILPCFNDALEVVGQECSSVFKIEYLVNLSDLQMKASSNKESLVVLLKEFLAFLGSHPFRNKHISVLTGLATQKELDCPIWIQYPLEEEKNVTKNVSYNEMLDMCEKARLSSKYLAANLQTENVHLNDFTHILGLPNILKLFANKSRKLDVSALFMDEQTKNTRKRMNRRKV